MIRVPQQMGFAGFQSLTREGYMLKAGQEAPSFEALAHTGETVKKSDFQEKYILLWFYPKADTPG